MSDEKLQTEEESPEETTPVVPARGGIFPKTISPVGVMGFVALVLVGVLIASLLRGGSGRSPAVDTEIVALQAEVDAHRAELNRQRIAFGLNPLGSGSEPIEDIADRLKKDAGTLAALAGRFQEMLADKDNQLIATSTDLLRADEFRQSQAAEISRLQQELQRASAGGPDSEALLRELAALTSQRDALASELAATREVGAGKAADAAALQVLERRLEETTRAKEFFESRVKELEGAPLLPPELEY